MDSDLDGLQGVKRWILAGHSMVSKGIGSLESNIQL